jgi:hypothetical protein
MTPEERYYANSDEGEIRHLRTENQRLRTALETIRRDYGRVCAEFELCDHVACASSVGAWFEADAALAGTTTEC